MEDGVWLSILDYSIFRGISVSTIRRYIKSSRVRFKKENGKYLIFVSKERYLKKAQLNSKSEVDESEVEDLRNQVRILKEENEDLKMLVHLYEFKNKKEEVGDSEGSIPPNIQLNNESRSQI